VYWLRRAVLIALVLVLLAAGYYVAKPAKKHRVATPKPSVSPSASPTATRPVVPVVKTCADSAIKISAATDAASYPPNTDVQLRLILQNVGTVNCLSDVGPGANSFTITSGGYATWASKDCQPPTGRTVKLLKPKQAIEITWTWHRERSLRGCPALSGEAQPGYYDLVVGSGFLLSNKSSFSIS
jgi:hypothetical protein